MAEVGWATLRVCPPYLAWIIKQIVESKEEGDSGRSVGGFIIY
jgi:hypothetical protein